MKPAPKTPKPLDNQCAGDNKVLIVLNIINGKWVIPLVLLSACTEERRAKGKRVSMASLCEYCGCVSVAEICSVRNAGLANQYGRRQHLHSCFCCRSFLIRCLCWPWRCAYIMTLLGSDIALYAKENLPKILLNSVHFKAKDYREALIESFIEIDKQLIEEWEFELATNSKARKRVGGTTACVALITPFEMYVANCGDSRCILSRNQSAHLMSADHKLTSVSERKRVLSAGGAIRAGKINGVLGIPRALGDLQFKSDKKLRLEEQVVTGMPEVMVERMSGVEFAVVACDGVWDCLGCQEVVDHFCSTIKNNKMLSVGIVEMFDKILPEEIDEDCMV
eukprot:TRINITY_DN677_c0_g2_i1.p1 TRINITY_DN677_c0_g2~~TRINITY_DN677_c0_g2_i1.p1  ORF type:complete len:336 (+),score=31.23 TRINITY_DN677_c0_g2_i1:67-1074(+)